MPRIVSVTGAVVGLGLASLVGAACSDETSDATPAATEAPAAPATDAPADTTTTTLGPYVPPPGDIVGQALTAANVPELAGQFSTLAGLLVRADPTAGLVHALQDDGSGNKLTVFAPLNSAFEKAPSVALEAVYADNDALTTVLTYHVVPGEFLAADLEDGQKLTTLQGEEITIGKEGDTITVNGAEVLAADVPATNGVIYVIGDVLVPPTVLEALGLG